MVNFFVNKIPFNKPYLTGQEIHYVLDAHQSGQLAGDGKYTKLSSDLLQDITGAEKVLLTHSCTAALEMAAILLDLKQGDEVIIPSYTFVSTANAFVLRGAVPVFVDVDIKTFNIDLNQIEAAITLKTKAIVAVHYAGVSCDMDALMCIASKYGLHVIEDAAQALLSSYKSQHLGSFGSMGSISFHETKNIISGEGGSLLINDKSFCERAEIIREKGTNRSSFFRGEVDKYTWVDIGSSFLPGELIAAFLFAQLQEAKSITRKRLDIWNFYFNSFAQLESESFLRRQHIPDYCQHNAHMFYLILRDENERRNLIDHLKNHGIHSVFHYVPLHSSPAGQRFGRTSGEFVGTQIAADRLLRLPMSLSVDAELVIKQIYNFFHL